MGYVPPPPPGYPAPRKRYRRRPPRPETLPGDVLVVIVTALFVALVLFR